MIRALSEALVSAAAAGDLEAAKVAHEAIARLLGSPEVGSPPANVLSLVKGKP